MFPIAVTELPCIKMLPFWAILNLVVPAAEAVKISPTPAWSTTKPAKDVFADTEAVGIVPFWEIRNLAEVELVPPIAKSVVKLALYKSPLLIAQ